MPKYNETWKASWPPPWEHSFQALSKGTKSMLLLCIQTFPVSVSRAGHTQLKLRGELIKTPRLSMMLKKYHSFLVHLPRKDDSRVVRHWCLDRTLLQILGVSIIETIKSSMEASYLPPPPHRRSHLRPDSSPFQQRGKKTGHCLLISTCIKSLFLRIPSNF